MAGSTVAVHRGAMPIDQAFVDEHNKVVADLELLRAKMQVLLAKLDADAGVTDANYASTLAVSSATVLTAGLLQ
jgi:hypothetical protein